jgi:hypothetical protein
MIHDAEARAAAAACAPISAADLAEAGGGVDLPGGKWARVQGPHLRSARKKFARNKTGCPGISFGRVLRRRRDGSFSQRHYYWVNLGSQCRAFSVESLGKSEAWRRAVALRAEHERRVAAINAAILAARHKKEAA